MSLFRSLMMAYVAQASSEPIDLSLQDVYGNPINRSTANCYVISKPGRYKFPAVYGNAIKNGEVNTAAFTNNGGSNSHDFVDGDNIVISQPYIGDIGYFYISNYDININEIFEFMYPSSFAEDGSLGLYTSEDECGWCYFTIKNVPESGGNFTISIKNVDGDAHWSWHIWLWPHDLTPVEITNSTGYTYNIMPTNLASKYDDDLIHIKNWFYQWGRPMPLLCPSAWNSTTDHSPGNITKASKASNLWTGLNNPTTFYYNERGMSEISSDWNWFGDKNYFNLWDAACTETGDSDNDTVKTVYDPCPVGWKVPNGNTFTGLSILSSANGIVKMRRYSNDTIGVEFPMSGCRYYSDGSLNEVGYGGFVWLSSANTKSMSNMMFSDGYIRPNGYSLEYTPPRGQSIRPVQDDIYDVDNIDICFKINDVTYKALYGMTWGDWIKSTFYNTGGYLLTPSHKVSSNGMVSGIIIPVASSTDVIVPGSEYTHNTTSGDSISVSWSTQSGSWTQGSNSSAYDGKQWTSVSPGSSGSTVIRCTFKNVTSITFNCVYNGESNYDYLTVGALDTPCTRSSYGTTLKGTSGTAKDITFNCDTGEHYVEFCYSKDGSVDTSPDCAVVFVKSVVGGGT